MCRVNGHVVFTASTGRFVTDKLVASVLWSSDGGKTFSASGGEAFYEQHVSWDSAGEYYSLALQADYDRLLRGDECTPPSKLCYNITVTNSDTSLSSSLVGCLKVCRRLSQFHAAGGYCPTTVKNNNAG